ncbi:MAG TPA: GIY-YIG nuclease family protein [Ignavibacteria bacterium]|nr:GIY-YIG nuclease family protein [Ignavibacteria bacterium]
MRVGYNIKNKFFVYILHSTKFDKYYVGSTANLSKRVEHHNSLKARWTKRYQPWILVFSEMFEDRSKAMTKEREIKRSKNISRYVGKVE